MTGDSCELHLSDSCVVCRKVKDEGHLTAAMAACHSLAIIDGEVAGDPLDVIMFKATDWVIN